MKKIELSQGLYVLVDDADFEYLNKWKWSATLCNKKFYAVRNVDDKPLYMHRLLLDAAKGQLVDHKNSNGLDNQRDNIRLSTHAGNNRNRKALKGYKGVLDRRATGRTGFSTRIKVKPTNIYIGHFPTAEIAGLAYDINALALFGEFANTNYPVVAYFDREEGTRNSAQS